MDTDELLIPEDVQASSSSRLHYISTAHGTALYRILITDSSNIPTYFSQPPSSPPSAAPNAFSSGQALLEIPELGETEVWIRYHPSSQLNSGLYVPTPQNQPRSQRPKPSNLPLYFPFQTYTDFLQAEIFCNNNCSDGHINEQLKLLHSTSAYVGSPATQRLTLKDASDYHATLSKASGALDQVLYYFNPYG